MNAKRHNPPGASGPPDEPDAAVAADSSAEVEANRITPLAGEAGIPSVAAASKLAVSWKSLLAAALMLVTLVVSLVLWAQRNAANKKPGDAEEKRMGDRPTAATAAPRRLDLPAQAPPAAPTASQATSQAGAPVGVRVPALQPDAELADPIGLRRTPSGAPASGPSKAAPPEDAPVLLVSTRPGAVGGASAKRERPGDADPEPANEPGPAANNDPVAATARNLQAYQQQVQSLLNTLTQNAQRATSQAAGSATSPAANGYPPTGALLGMPPGAGHPSAGTPMGAPAAPSGGLFGGQLPSSATPRLVASQLGNRSLTLPKGTAFTCALKTKVISAVSGLVGCQVQRDVYSDNGRVLLIERGSHLDGEYRITSVKPGMVRIPVLWTSIRTPLGVTVDIDSPGTGQLGESGIDGYVDNRWPERLGAAMLLSLIDDSVRMIIQHQNSDNQSDTIVLPSTTATGSKLAEKVLDSTINIPPLIYQNQGGIVGIYVARDVDFSSVYELKPVP